MDLLAHFNKINEAHFDGFLDPPILQWNQRLKTSAGRFIPGKRKWIKTLPPKIEVASYLLEEAQASHLVIDTLSHEMIHYWLWVRGKPYGHTPEFLAKMEQMGVSRYNSVPRRRPAKYLYRCEHCLKEFQARKKLGPLACAYCCKKHSDGSYDSRFLLKFVKELTKADLPS